MTSLVTLASYLSFIFYQMGIIMIPKSCCGTKGDNHAMHIAVSGAWSVLSTRQLILLTMRKSARKAGVRWRVGSGKGVPGKWTSTCKGPAQNWVCGVRVWPAVRRDGAGEVRVASS